MSNVVNAASPKRFVNSHIYKIASVIPERGERGKKIKKKKLKIGIRIYVSSIVVLFI